MGTDTLNGRTGNDTYVIEGTFNSDGYLITDSITEAASSGKDTVKLTVLGIPALVADIINYTLDSNIENLTLDRVDYDALALQVLLLRLLNL